MAFSPLGALAEDSSTVLDETVQDQQVETVLDEDIVEDAVDEQQSEEAASFVDDTTGGTDSEALPSSESAEPEEPAEDGQEMAVENDEPADVEEELTDQAIEDSELTASSDSSALPSVQYSAHVQNVGWQPFVKDGALGGTSGRSLRMEALKVTVSLPKGVAGGVEYRSQVQNVGWLSWVRDGALCG
ncbi:MAG: hypothetical protein IJ092_12515 [Atopobiaceae bacterium]|nr:hypothetical protein [Atopobiaceae bacterium]